MNSERRTFSLLTLSLVFVIAAVSAYSQGDQPKQAEPSYEATLHVLARSDQAGSAESLPPALTAVARQVRSVFGTGNLKLVNMYLGRTTAMGNLEYKGISNAYVKEMDAGPASFLDWRLTGLQNLKNASGETVYQFQTFRFGARIPIKISNFRDDAGKGQGVINYEPIGLTLDRISVHANTPTLVGTLTQPKTDGTLFLVLTVRNVDK